MPLHVQPTFYYSVKLFVSNGRTNFDFPNSLLTSACVKSIKVPRYSASQSLSKRGAGTLIISPLYILRGLEQCSQPHTAQAPRLLQHPLSQLPLSRFSLTAR